ncbi:MAG: hypothetical protein RLZZ318_460 [Bacteroidota bacterium]|jgi:hypothetical protein
MTTLYQNCTSDLKVSEPLLFPNKQFSKNYNHSPSGKMSKSPKGYRNQHEIQDLIQMLCLNFVRYQRSNHLLN